MRYAKPGIFLVLLFAVGGWRLLVNTQESSSAATAEVRPGAPTTATQPSTRAVLRPRAIKGVENFAQIAPNLYRGAQPTAEGFAELKKMGIKTIVNLRAIRSDRDDLKGLGLGYLHLSCKAWHPEDEDVVQVLKVINDPAAQPVFIHCQHGADRTGTMVAVYRMLEQGWPIEDAVAELNDFGFHTIWQQITTYLKKFDPEAMRKKVQAAPPVKIECVE